MEYEQKMCEAATGCVQTGEIIYYNDNKETISLDKAIKLFNSNETIEVPSAGAGNYTSILIALGFQEVEVIDWTSSAGDWTFGVKNKDGWFVVVQENRYPYHGFRYTLSDLIESCETFEQLCEAMDMI